MALMNSTDIIMRTTIEGSPGFRQYLGWDSEMSCPRKLPKEKTKRIQSSPTWQPPGYDPQALALSHIGPTLDPYSNY